MNNVIDFINGMAAYYNTTASSEQIRFVDRFQRHSIDVSQVLLIEADGGIGKTLAYLVCGLREAQKKNLPVIVATSTITNRDQIQYEFAKIIEYARLIDDPIANIRLFNFHSMRDYINPARLEQMIEDCQKTGSSKTVMDELYEIRDRVAEGHILMDNVMPHDIEDGNEVISRRLLSTQFGDNPIPQFIVDSREEVKSHLDQACVVVVTHAMLATYRPFKKLITEHQVALVVIDEVDKLTTIDFITYTSVMMKTIDDVISTADSINLDVCGLQAIFNDLQDCVDEIKNMHYGRQTNVILIYEKIGEDLTRKIYNNMRSLTDQLDVLDAFITELPVDDLSNELAYRSLLMSIRELSDATDRLGSFMYPNERDKWTADTTQIRVFFSWDEGDEFRIVSARPGALIEWLFRRKMEVPVLLTTAFLGETDRSFARKIGLPFDRLTRDLPIRAINYGTAKFIYFTGLHDTMTEDSDTKKRAYNPAHMNDIDRLLRLSPWAWNGQDRKRILVLTPGYRDIGIIKNQLETVGSNAPIFPHLKGTNINDIREKLIQSPVGGILLTVYWEGFNIVGDDPNRRGLVDVLLMSRIPFQRPNRMLETLYKHLGWSEFFAYRDLRIEAKRRIHQGFNRLIRGPNDNGVILICDNRFPPPTAITNIYEGIYSKKDYSDLLDAIPDRFRSEDDSFELYDAKTWEKIL